MPLPCFDYRGRSSMNRCPKCHSSAIDILYPTISCITCGHTEPLIDFPVSHGFHRSMMYSYRGIDIGECYPPQVTADPSETVKPQTSQHKQVRIRELQEQVKGMQLALSQLYKRMNQMTPKPSTPNPVSTKQSPRGGLEI